MKAALNRALISVGLAPLAHKTLETVRAIRAPKNPAADANGLPFPPRRLTQLVTGNMNARDFLASGENCANFFKILIDRNGGDFASMARVLDFGCGCGRLARHMPHFTRAEFHGCDLHPRLIEWCQDNLEGQYIVNNLTPPLPYDDAYFDGLYMLSVFTHLRLDTQNLWIREMARIMKPGGVALVTFHDEHHANGTPAIKVLLEKNGFFVRNDFSEGSNFMGTFQTQAFIKAQFEADFETLEIVDSTAPGNSVSQAVIVLKRRDA